MQKRSSAKILRKHCAQAMPGITECAIENFKAVRRADMQGFCFEKKSAQAKPRAKS
jgi:hypothetical protein